MHLTLHESRLPSLVSFLYIEEPLAVGIIPQHGPVRGGTPVTISGLHLAPTPPLSCCFETSSRAFCTMGHSLTTTQLECVTPQLHQDQSLLATVRVVFTSGAPTKMAGSLQRYTFHRHVRVRLAQPQHGPMHGGTLVLLHGLFDARVAQQGMVVCSFNATKVLASGVSDQVTRALVLERYPLCYL